MKRDLRDDAGMTLVEVLLAIAILGLGVVVIVGGMMTSIKVSAQGRQSAESQTTLRGYAEAVAGASYVDCAVASSYSTAAIGYTAPSGYVPTLAVSYWTASGASGSFGTGTCTADTGLQRLVLTVTAGNGTTETLRTIKRRLT